MGLRTPQSSAEELKKKYGCALSSTVSETETIEVEGVGGRKSRSIPRKDLADVLEARAEETLGLIANDIRASGLLPLLGSGVVLSGGASQLEGLVEMGEYIFDVPVRRGVPGYVGGLTEVIKSAEYATCVGLLLYGYQQRKDLYAHHENDFDPVDGLSKKVRDFFSGLF
ncbi:MAG: hypothetical protein N2578_05850 [Bdellovibrionaceae bacterium]|nr:hypothetical protein [Pseudobdellovibrionaceae bacterium]